MMTEYEARKLTESMQKELDAGEGAVRQCVAGLLILIVILLTGTVFPPTTGRLLDATNAAAGMHQPVAGVEAHDQAGVGKQALHDSEEDLPPVPRAGEPMR